MEIESEKLVELTRGLVLEGFEPHYGARAQAFSASPVWAKMRELGSELWLDTGDIAAAGKLWTREMGALTTNNTLLNKEVQKGTYDTLVTRAANALRKAFPAMDEAFLVREIAFVLNAYHGLRLVEQFDAFVSVEEHTDLAHDVAAAVGYARRYHAICPERFIVKLPLTAAGLLAAAQVGTEGIPVNLTLGFGARQNVLVTAVARPRFCNVFLGRLNQVVTENKLGDGQYVGEKATMASQRVVKALGRSLGAPTKQIAASLRSGEQVRDLAGVDVLTIPPAAADEFARTTKDAAALSSAVEKAYEPRWAAGVDAKAWALDSLWDVPYGLERAALEIVSIPDLDPAGLLKSLKDAGFGAVLPQWSKEDVAAATQDGKIPKLARWKDRLAKGEIGLDALMNLHGLQSFVIDQKAMDDRIRGLIGKK